ncbi:hypothetical protein EKO04_010653 [Ascochyta lentis]|uniref:Uncharacterized protein n=1 Tax=Ascochyta lentis TaxID=205686 RepID=A0A8H7IUT3_9PLEO|nr:hypothetical protein EKO04_010653 [Ascochyta lentis]
MAPKPKLILDMSNPNSTYQANPWSTRNNKRVANYVGLVTKLRNPITAGPINKWMTTGRVVGHPVGMADPVQRQPELRYYKPQSYEPQSYESEVSAEAYKDFFGEDMSGSLSGAMGGYVSARLNQTREETLEFEELQECEGILELSYQGTVEEASQVEKPLSCGEPVIKRYPYPPSIYTQNRSDEEYLALFAALVSP